ncbi:Aste57867_17906 [Aphanomyces stellatus]|uniref:Aste57867_17906 protein n=1 Tax=Aphanomyces stellatus TaxID=120398 RepID=A0A485L8Y8_9STRA|nr:hypothetical protein As57867_017845 [Aphanomyces stellatus]VFT94648.1 Aste57867_17906 [Aphanomyces stellatus]
MGVGRMEKRAVKHEIFPTQHVYLVYILRQVHESAVALAHAPVARLRLASFYTAERAASVGYTSMFGMGKFGAASDNAPALFARRRPSDISGGGDCSVVDPETDGFCTPMRGAAFSCASLVEATFDLTRIPVSMEPALVRLRDCSVLTAIENTCHVFHSR